MQRIHLIGNKRGCYSRHLHPVRTFTGELRDLGMDIRYFSKPTAAGISDCDVLVFFEGSYRDILPIRHKDRAAAIDYLASYFRNFDRVIWFDDHDSSGMLRTYVFPMVHGYAKSQVLRSQSYYQEPHLTGILHRDYVHEGYSLDDVPAYKGSVTDQELSKIRLGWNLGLSNWAYLHSNSILFRHSIHQHGKGYRIRYHSQALSTRNIHVAYRANMWERVPTVHWWRQKTAEALAKFQQQNPGYIIPSNAYLKKSEYLREIRDSMVTLSAFGYGEVCYRDFECFINGSLLFKPDMSHLITWPDLFIDGVTCITHRWDFSDFSDKLETILSHPGRYEAIAREGQRRFQDILQDGQAFAAHFKEMIA